MDRGVDRRDQSSERPAQSPGQDRAEQTPGAWRLPSLVLDWAPLSPNVAAVSRASSSQGAGSQKAPKWQTATVRACGEPSIPISISKP